jgi:hypothetical protein
MAGLVPAICRGTVLAAMAGTRPAMTVGGVVMVEAADSYMRVTVECEDEYPCRKS